MYGIHPRSYILICVALSGACVASAVSAKGRLEISSEPGGAKVFIEGHPKGITATQPGKDLVVELDEGEYRLEATVEGDFKYQVSQKVAVYEGVVQPVPLVLLPVPDLVAIKGGCFQMGSPEKEKDRQTDEKQHEVCVKDFKLGKYEVTQAQWKAVMGNNPSEFKPCPTCPVEQVAWSDVQNFLTKLNNRTGQHYRLPTEAEWEYAARAGTTTPFWTGNCVHTDQANYDGNYDYAGCGAKTGVYREKTTPVGSLQPNPWGLYDTLGNVWEWTCSAYQPTYDGSESSCATRNYGGLIAIRGGSWYGRAWSIRVANRDNWSPFNRNYFLGFRLAQDQ